MHERQTHVRRASLADVVHRNSYSRVYGMRENKSPDNKSTDSPISLSSYALPTTEIPVSDRQRERNPRRKESDVESGDEREKREACDSKAQTASRRS